MLIVAVVALILCAHSLQSRYPLTAIAPGPLQLGHYELASLNLESRTQIAKQDLFHSLQTTSHSPPCS